MKKLVAFLFLLIYTSASFACSTFLLSKDGQLVFGRNYDWVSGNGMVVVNAHGVEKTSFVTPGEKPVRWVSQCGSITFNQFGKEFPHGGMNERGLVVELMWLSESAYPDADERGALNELQWIQYQLDNFTSVDEVIASDNQVRISGQAAAPLHYLVADAYGNAATIEFIKGKMVVHRGSELPQPVLTNTVYGLARKQLELAQSKEGTPADNSMARFAIACRMVADFQQTDTRKPPVDYAFHILDQIAQGAYTKWRIVYDITNRKIEFITGSTRKQLALKDFDFSCSGSALFLDVNHSGSGPVAAHFKPLGFAQNQEVLLRSVRESNSQIQIPEERTARAVAYFRQVSCASR